MKGPSLKRLGKYAFKNRFKSFLVLLFDLLGTLLTVPFRFFRKKVNPDKIRKILVVRLDHLGDVVMTRPAIQALWRKYPGVQIDLVVSAENVVLFDDAKEIRNIMPVTGHWFSPLALFSHKMRTFFRILAEIRNVKYDLAIDFRGDFRHILLMFLAGIPQRVGYGITGGGFLLTHEGHYSFEEHQVVLNMALLKAIGMNEAALPEPFTYSGERKRRFWNLYGEDLARVGSVKRIVIHAGAGYPSKRWPSDRYDELVKRILYSKLGQIVLVGTEAEKEIWRGPTEKSDWIVDLRGKTRICDLPILYDASQIFVGSDSGPAHIAAAQGIEVVVIYSGTNDHRVWCPWTEHLNLIRQPVDCSPCEQRLCPLQHHDCMKKITVSQVFDAIKTVLAAKDPLSGTLSDLSET
jgi:heptosyltransferase-2